VGKGTFYNYFGTKEAVIGFYLASEAAKSREILRPVLHQLPDTKSRLLRAMHSWTRFVRENRELVRVQMAENFKIYLTMGEADPDKIGFRTFLSEILNLGQSQGDIRHDISPEDMGMYLELLFFGPGSWYCAVSEDFPLEAKLSEAISLFLEGAAL
jgi:AcrR family transcriptional regulator